MAKKINPVVYQNVNSSQGQVKRPRQLVILGSAVFLRGTKTVRLNDINRPLYHSNLMYMASQLQNFFIINYYEKLIHNS